MLNCGRIQQYKLDKLQKKHGTIYPFNQQYTIEEKLDIAINMFEALSELHGFIDGVIIMDDVVLWQWLQSDYDNRYILNDFGNSILLP
jgi:hypothetical protein